MLFDRGGCDDDSGDVSDNGDSGGSCDDSDAGAGSDNGSGGTDDGGIGLKSNSESED